MSFWKENVDRILEFADQKILVGNGTISHEQMVDKIYEAYDSKRKKQEAEQADALDME